MRGGKRKGAGPKFIPPEDRRVVVSARTTKDRAAKLKLIRQQEKRWLDRKIDEETEL